MKILILFFLVLYSYRSFGANYEDSVDTTKVFSLIFTNDIFNQSDRYYTNGVLFKYTHPVFSKFIGKNIFLDAQTSASQYSLLLINRIFTPSDTHSEEVVYDDRPYCAYTVLNYEKQSKISSQKLFLNSIFQIGILGEHAFGDVIQSTIHNWIDNPVPKGWDNQIASDIVLNYNVTIDKNILHLKHFSLNPYFIGRLGTLHTDITLGMRLHLGWLNYGQTGGGHWFDFNKDKWKIMLFTDISGTAVGYNATLQGGVFNTSSVHTFSYAEITPLLLYIQPGLIVQYKRFGMELRDSYSTKDFKNGESHMFGTIHLFFNI